MTTPPHPYLSTGCFHGITVDRDGNEIDGHAYCRSMTGLSGRKRPGECKFCGARCVCPCHEDRS